MNRLARVAEGAGLRGAAETHSWSVSADVVCAAAKWAAKARYAAALGRKRSSATFDAGAFTAGFRQRWRAFPHTARLPHQRRQRHGCRSAGSCAHWTRRLKSIPVQQVVLHAGSAAAVAETWASFEGAEIT